MSCSASSPRVAPESRKTLAGCRAVISSKLVTYEGKLK